MPASKRFQAELEHGNLPSFLWHLRPVDAGGQGGRRAEAPWPLLD